jgi:hypothetical protein
VVGSLGASVVVVDVDSLSVVVEVDDDNPDVVVAPADVLEHAARTSTAKVNNDERTDIPRIRL